MPKMSDEFHEARMFRPKAITDWFDLLIRTVAVAGIIGAIFVGSVRAFLPQWYNAPDKIAELSEDFDGLSEDLEQLGGELAALRGDLKNTTPQLLDFKGTIIVTEEEVAQGQELHVTLVVRRNVSCDTTVRVRFWDHGSNTIASRHSYDIPAVKAPVSANFQAFPLSIFIPFDLPPGRYSYFPEIIPLDCGVYRPLVPPMSLPFDVLAG